MQCGIRRRTELGPNFCGGAAPDHSVRPLPLALGVSEWLGDRCPSRMPPVLHAWNGLGHPAVSTPPHTHTHTTHTHHSHKPLTPTRAMARACLAFEETCRILFNAADEDGSASLDPEEFRAVLQSDALGLHLTSQELDSVIQEADQDASGTITLDEVPACWERPPVAVGASYRRRTPWTLQFIPVVEKLFYRRPAKPSSAGGNVSRHAALGVQPHNIAFLKPLLWTRLPNSTSDRHCPGNQHFAEADPRPGHQKPLLFRIDGRQALRCCLKGALCMVPTGALAPVLGSAFGPG